MEDALQKLLRPFFFRCGDRLPRRADLANRPLVEDRDVVGTFASNTGARAEVTSSNHMYSGVIARARALGRYFC